jgi:hypothetical protein
MDAICYKLRSCLRISYAGWRPIWRICYRVKCHGPVGRRKKCKSCLGQLRALANVSFLRSPSLGYFELSGDGQANMTVSIILRSLSLGAPSRANVDIPWMTAIVRLANASAAVSFGS